MLICILGICIIIMLFLWAIVAGARKEDDYEAQMHSLEEWTNRHREE